jgi:hypothetical protein
MIDSIKDPTDVHAFTGAGNGAGIKREAAGVHLHHTGYESPALSAPGSVVSRAEVQRNVANCRIAKMRMAFDSTSGEPAGINIYDPPPNRRTGNVAGFATHDVYGSKVTLGGGMKGAAAYTEKPQSLPDLVFDLDRAKVCPGKYVNKPGIGVAIPIRLKYLASQSSSMPLLEMCASIGETEARDSEKISFIQQVIVDILHKKRYFGGETGRQLSFGGRYESAPWHMENISRYTMKDIDRIRKKDESIAAPTNAYPLSKFWEDRFGDCRATNLIQAFCLQAAGFGEVFVSNIYWSAMEYRGEIEELDELQVSFGRLMGDLISLNNEDSVGTNGGAQLEGQKFSLERKKNELQDQVRALKGTRVSEHTIVIMKEPSTGRYIFLDAYAGEFNGVPVLETGKLLTLSERQKMKLIDIKNRSFYSQKRLVDGHPKLERSMTKFRAFLTYPLVLDGGQSSGDGVIAATV